MHVFQFLIQKLLNHNLNILCLSLQHIESVALSSLQTDQLSDDPDFDLDTPDEKPLYRFDLLGMKMVNVYNACPKRGNF